MDEEWRPILDADEGYEISNLGRVRSWKNRYSFGTRDVWLDEPRILSIQTHYLGYQYILLRVNGRSKKFYIHQLVGRAFLDNPENKPEVNHDDGNKKDCSVNNLVWNTRAENMAHARRMGLWDMEGSLKKAREAWITPIYCYEKDCVYESGEEAAKDIGVCKALITHVCRGESHNAKGFHLCYLEEKEWLLDNIDRIKAIEGGKRAIKAVNIDTGEERIYSSRKDASIDLGIHNTTISNIIAGRMWQSRRWTFKNVEMEAIERRPGYGGH